MVEVGLGVFSGEWHPGHGARSRRDAARVDRPGRPRRARRPRQRVGERAPLPRGPLRRVGRRLRRRRWCRRRRRITVGFGLALAPLHDPIRFAEDAAFLDLLSSGRCVVGLGLGYRDIEFEGFGGHRRERVGRTVELIDICRQAWAGELGRHRRPLLPPPRPRRHPAPVPAGRAPDHARRPPPQRHRPGRGPVRPLLHGRRHRLGVLRAGHGPQPRSRSPASSRPCAATATPSSVTASRATDPPFSLNVGGFLHPDGRDAAWATLAEAYMLTRRVYGDWYGLEPAEYADVVPRPADAGAGRPASLGDPPRHARRHRPVLERVREVVGDNLHVMFRSKYPLVDDAATRQSIDLLGEVRRRLDRLSVRGSRAQSAVDRSAARLAPRDVAVPVDVDHDVGDARRGEVRQSPRRRLAPSSAEPTIRSTRRPRSPSSAIDVGDGGDVEGVGRLDPEPAVAAPAGPSQRRRRRAADEDRHRRGPASAGTRRRPAAVVRAVEALGSAGPARPQQVDPLVGARCHASRTGWPGRRTPRPASRPPTPSTTRPPASRSRLATCLASTTGLRWGRTSTAVPSSTSARSRRPPSPEATIESNHGSSVAHVATPSSA